MDDPFQFNTNNALSPGQVFLDRYTLVKFLGRGGMGQVWLVKDSLLGEEIALKFLPSEIMADRAALEDLKRETMRSRKLSHPHIVKVYDFTTAHNSGAISMEYVSGGTLADVRYDMPGAVMDATDPRFATWMIQLAEALAYAHESVGIVHRDLKPQNLMLDGQGNLKLADFGVSRSLTDSMSRLSRQNAGSSGTHIYMSPQQAQGNAPAVADDIYAFGATIYDLLTGKPPFFRGNIQHQIDTVEPEPMNIRRTELVEDMELPPVAAFWETLVARCLKKHPSERPASMKEIIGMIQGGEEIAAQPQPPPRQETGAEQSAGGGASPPKLATSMPTGMNENTELPELVTIDPHRVLPASTVDTKRRDQTSRPVRTKINKTVLMSVCAGVALLALVANQLINSGPPPGGTVGGDPLGVEFPPELIDGTPKPMNVPNLVQVPEKAPTFLVPKGTVLLSKYKKVTSSDYNPIIGSLDLITDGDKEAGEGYFVELLDGTQWVQIDLEKSAAVYAVCVWHFHSQRRAYHDVIVQVSDDPEFKTGVTTVYNNDYDDSSKLGKGSDNPYVESRFGLIADGKGAKGRYVRLYSRGNTSNEMNQYTEVEVHGIP